MRHSSLGQADVMAWLNISQKAPDSVQGTHPGALRLGMEVQGGGQGCQRENRRGLRLKVLQEAVRCTKPC